MGREQLDFMFALYANIGHNQWTYISRATLDDFSDMFKRVYPDFKEEDILAMCSIKSIGFLFKPLFSRSTEHERNLYIQLLSDIFDYSDTDIRTWISDISSSVDLYPCYYVYAFQTLEHKLDLIRMTHTLLVTTAVLFQFDEIDDILELLRKYHNIALIDGTELIAQNILHSPSQEKLEMTIFDVFDHVFKGYGRSKTSIQTIGMIFEIYAAFHDIGIIPSLFEPHFDDPDETYFGHYLVPFVLLQTDKEVKATITKLKQQPVGTLEWTDFVIQDLEFVVALNKLN